MSAVHSLLFFVVLLHMCGSSEGLENITVEPGQNVTLTCKDPENHTVVLLEWSRDGTETKKLMVIREGRPLPAATHESFRNRVFLKDNETKDGDLSVVLKNLTTEDTGTYKCKVGHENDPPGSPLKLISIIRLSVDPPGDKGGRRGEDVEKKDEGEEEEAGMSKGYIAVVPVLLLLLLAVVGFWIYKRRTNRHRDSPEQNEQQIPLRSLNRNPEASAD